MEEYKTGSLPKPFTQIILRYITEINVEDKTIKTVEENTGEYICDLEIENIFSNLKRII